MRLAGIDGVLVHGRDEVYKAVNTAVHDETIGILLINETCAQLCPDLIGDLKLNISTPLLVEIPDRHGTGRSADSITKYIRESIGIKI
jgi:V/A-type H+-transporting ATPase subunit F